MSKKKTRYFLDKTGGVKIPSSLSERQIEMLAQDFLRQGMKEVSHEEWYVAKKRWEVKSLNN